LVVNEQLLAAEALGLTVVRFPSPPPRADETVAKQGFNCLAARKLGSGLIDHSQNMTAAAMQIAEK
jgi:hypothetical protein